MGLTIERCLQAWTNTLKQMNAKADIVFYGDSLIYYGDFASLFPNKVVCNLGLRGDTIQGLINRVEQVVILKPQVLFIMAGINDIASLTTEEFREVYTRLINEIKLIIPETKILIISILPVNNSRFIISCTNEQVIECNKVVSRIAFENKIPFLDLHSLYVENGELPCELTKDGIHLKTNGYKRWYELLINLNY